MNQYSLTKTHPGGDGLKQLGAETQTNASPHPGAATGQNFWQQSVYDVENLRLLIPYAT